MEDAILKEYAGSRVDQRRSHLCLVRSKKSSRWQAVMVGPKHENEWHFTNLPKHNAFFSPSVFSCTVKMHKTGRKITLLGDEIDRKDHQVPMVISQRKDCPLGLLRTTEVFLVIIRTGGVGSIL